MLVLVTTQKTRRVSLVKSLNEHGVFVFITSPEDACRMVEAKDTGGVLLDTHACLSACERICTALRERYPQMPIGAIVSKQAIPKMAVNRIIREDDSTTTDEEVLDFCIQNCGYHTKHLSTYCLSVANAPEETLYMGYRMPLSPKEHTILRFLFYREPAYTSLEDLLELCYPEGNVKVENVTVLISRINQRARQIDGHNLIVHRRKMGYRLRDGILLPKSQ
jgi:DNA-binding response OmpR family regulator